MKKLLGAALALVTVLFVCSVVTTRTAWADVPADFPSGMLFGGYYEDAGCTVVSKAPTSYWRAVDPHVLDVKYQLIPGEETSVYDGSYGAANEDSAKTKIRIVTTVDRLDYKCVGLHVWIDDVPKDVGGKVYQTTQVAQTIKSSKGLGNFYYTPKVFSNSSEYFFAFNFTVNSGGTGASAYSKRLKFQAYWITKDGEEVRGTAREIVIQNSNYYNNILVGDAEKLQDVAEASATETYERWKIRLTSDIDLNPGFTASTSGFSDGKSGTPTEWSSIGPTASGGKKFKGKFFGDGHTISGLYQTSGTGDGYCGLFGATETGSVIQNFRLENSYIEVSGLSRVGSIAGYGNGTYSDIYSNAIIKVTGGSNIGGMIGYIETNSDNITYSNLHFDGSLTGTSGNIGGILGADCMERKTENYKLTIENCRNSGVVSTTGAGAGGMVGNVLQREAGATYPIVDIKGCWNENKVYAGSSCGSLVGNNGTGCTVNLSDDLNTYYFSGYGAQRNPIGSDNGTTTYARLLDAGRVPAKKWVNSSSSTSVTLTSVIGTGAVSNLGFSSTYWSDSTYDVAVPKAFEGKDSMFWSATGADAAHAYLVKSPANLLAVVEKSQTYPFYVGGVRQYIKLDVDLNMNPDCVASSTGMSNSPMAWGPINPNNTEGKKFAGIFDGQGHTIRGLYQNGGAYRGLFGAVQGGAQVKNFSLKNSYIETDGSRVGSIAGYGNGTFTNIDSDAYVNSTYRAGGANCIGGMIGYTQGGTTYTDLRFTGTVTASNNSWFIGGILGQADHSSGTLTFANCLNSGTVTTGDEVLGGIVGSVYNSGTVSITGCWNSGTLSAENGNIGTFVGKVKDAIAPTINITDCLNSYVGQFNVVGDRNGGTVNYSGVLDAGRAPVAVWDSAGEPSTPDFTTDILGDSATTNLNFTSGWATRTNDLPVPSAFAGEPSIWDAAGTAGAPYVISTAVDMLVFSAKSQTYNFNGKVVKLGADIDLNPGWTATVSATAPATTWTSIGPNGVYFIGTFDGQGHNICGLYQKDTETTGEVYMGLFGVAATASTVQNFYLKNSYIYTVGQRVGSIAGNGNGMFTNIYSNAIIEGTGDNAKSIGGMIGYYDGGANKTFSGLHFAGSLSATNNSGGIVGYVKHGANITLTIANCRNNGTVETSSTGSGGIVGYVSLGTSKVLALEGCWNSGIVSASKSNSTGGLIGMPPSSGSLSITNCLSSGECGSIAGVASGRVTAITAVLRYNSGTWYRTYLQSSNIKSAEISTDILFGDAWKESELNTTHGFTTDNWVSQAGSYPIPKGCAENTYVMHIEP